MVESGELEEVDLSEYVVQNDEQMRRIARVIASTITLEGVSLKRMGLGTAGVRAVAKAVEDGGRLKRLDLAWNGVDAAGATRLSRTIRLSETLHELYLGGNPIGD